MIDINFANIAGQEHAKRALEVALAGNHSILLVGPPNSGKTMLLHAAGQLCYQTDDPLLAPTYVDGYRDLLRWSAARLEQNVLTLAAIRPCLCGYYGDDTHMCACNIEPLATYRDTLIQYRNSIHIHIQINAPTANKLKSNERETTAIIRERIVIARKGARGRQQSLPNGLMNDDELARHCQIDEAGHRLLRAAQQQGMIDARTWNNTLRIARTCADLAGETNIQLHHLAEALQYRPRHDDIISNSNPNPDTHLPTAYQVAFDALCTIESAFTPPEDSYLGLLIAYGKGELPIKPEPAKPEPLQLLATGNAWPPGTKSPATKLHIQNNVPQATTYPLGLLVVYGKDDQPDQTEP